MSQRPIEELLQECLAAYEAGVAPEDCLLPFPRERAQLEPLLRQALSLRIAMAAAPSDRFREKAREKLLFAAGRDAVTAYNAEPDEEYVSCARDRFLQRAGVTTQEALRAVPPPRLPFWINARRRLLEAASMPHPVARPAPALSLRPALSGAIAALVIAITSLALLTSRGGPDSVNDEFASLQERLVELEQQAAAGQPPSPGALIELTRRTNELAQKLSTDDAPAPIADKLPEIIERQRDVLAAGDASTSAEAQQQLNQAEQVVRLLAARAESPTPLPSQEAVVVAPTKAPPATATPTAKPATTPDPTATTEPLKAGQVRLTPLPKDTTFGYAWSEVRTLDISFVIAASWHVNGITGTNGTYDTQTSLITITGPDTTVVVNSKTGEVNALIAGQQVPLRTASGQALSVDLLVEKGGDVVLELRHMLETLEIAVKPAATPSPSVTPAP